MLDRIIYFSIHNKLIIFILLAILIGVGIFSMRNLPLDALPDITDNQVQIITSSPDLSAQEVERFITYPLEMEMGNIPKVDEIRSISRFGLSVITIVFNENVDIYWAREQINQKIQKAKTEIPKELGSPEMGPISTGLGEIYQYVIYPADGYEDTYNPTDLRSIQDWIVKRQIIGIPGVVEVNSLGGYLKQYEIAIHQNKLKSFNLSMGDVFDAISENNANAGGSYIEKSNQTFFIRGEGMVKTMADLENILVAHRTGNPILIKHVAEVQIGHAPRFGAVTMNGKGEVVAGQVMMLKGANSQKVTNEVKERIEEIKSSLPEGIVLEPYLDRSKLVNRTTNTVLENLLVGALIVVFILVLLLGNMRAGLIVASVIPLAMLFAACMMRAFGVSANLMSLGALDFGLIVDGAVIIVEAIMHHLGLQKGKNLSDAMKEQEVFKAASKIRTSAAFGEIIILIVYVPILFLQGIEGKMFIPMAQTVGFAILGALILSLTYVPMMSAIFLKNAKFKENNLSSRIINGAYKMYAPVRDFAFRIKYWVLAFSIILLAFSLFIFSKMGGEFIPTLEEGDFALHQILPSGSSIKKGVEVSAKLQNILMSEFPEIEKVVTKIGTAEIPVDIMPLEAGDIFVIMKPKSEWTSARTREEMFVKMEEALNKYPGIIYEFTQPIQMRFNELMTGIRQDIAIKIYGDDLGLLVEKANKAESILQNVTGVGDIQVEATTGLQQMVVDYDRAKMNKYGVNVTHLNDVLKTAFAGKFAGNFYEGEKKFDIVVRLHGDERKNIESLKDLLVSVPNGGFVPLSEMAKISFEEGPAQISRDNTKRRITLGVNARNIDIATLIANIKAAFEAELDLPDGYYLRYGGQFENMERAMSRLILVVPVSLLLIFILLFFTFNSVKYALLIFTAIPLSAIGGIWALYIRDMAFSISAGVGFIALFGVAVLNGIVLIAYFNQLKKEGMTDISEIIRIGTKVRLRPVLMTAAVASLGFLPMALSTSAGAEVQRPLATVVIGGLITATFLTLIILPILYQLIEKSSVKKAGKLVSFLLPLFLIGTMSAQQNLTLNEALDKISVGEKSLITSLQLQKESYRLNQEEPLASLPWNISVGGEEFNLDGISGVQYLSVQKSFRLPGVVNAYKELYQHQLSGLDTEATLQNISLKGRLSEIYIEAAYYHSLKRIQEDRRSNIDDLFRVSEQKSRTGESSGIIARQAKLRLDRLNLDILGIENRLEILNNLINDWLGMEGYGTTSLEEIDLETRMAVGKTNPALQYLDDQANVLMANAKIADANTKPQPFAKLSFQSVDGQTLFYGYQLGMILPFSSAYKKNLKKSSEHQSAALAEKKAWKQNQIKMLESHNQGQIDKNKEIINQLNNQIEQHQDILQKIREAYAYGELSYSDIVLAQEDIYKLKKDKLDLLKDNLLYINQMIHNTTQKLP